MCDKAKIADNQRSFIVLGFCHDAPLRLVAFDAICRLIIAQGLLYFKYIGQIFLSRSVDFLNLR